MGSSGLWDACGRAWIYENRKQTYHFGHNRASPKRPGIFRKAVIGGPSIRRTTPLVTAHFCSIRVLRPI